MFNPAAKQMTLEASLEQFDLREADRVQEYLQRNSFLLPIIFEAQAQIARLFSLSTKTVLEVTTDPSDGTSQLYLVVPTKLRARAAYELFERFEQEWWLEASARAQFRMNIVPEFTDVEPDYIVQMLPKRVREVEVEIIARKKAEPNLVYDAPNF